MIPFRLEHEILQTAPEDCRTCDEPKTICRELAKAILTEGVTIDQAILTFTDELGERCTRRFIRSVGWASTESACGYRE